MWRFWGGGEYWRDRSWGTSNTPWEPDLNEVPVSHLRTDAEKLFLHNA